MARKTAKKRPARKAAKKTARKTPARGSKKKTTSSRQRAAAQRDLVEYKARAKRLLASKDDVIAELGGGNTPAAAASAAPSDAALIAVTRDRDRGQENDWQQ